MSEDVSFIIQGNTLTGVNLPERFKRFCPNIYNGNCSVSCNPGRDIWFLGRGTYDWDEWADTAFSIPYSINKIADHSFQKFGCYEIKFPSSIKQIGDNWSVFYQCLFQRLTLPGVRTLKLTFKECIFLGELKLSEGTTTLDNLAINNCRIKELVLPYSLKEIKQNSLSETKIEKMVVHSGVTHWAFGNYGNGPSTKNSSYFNKVDNLIYEGSRRSLKQILLDSQKVNRGMFPIVWVDENQIIHCNDGDIKCVNTDGHYFQVEEL